MAMLRRDSSVWNPVRGAHRVIAGDVTLAMLQWLMPMLRWHNVTMAMVQCHDGDDHRISAMFTSCHRFVTSPS